MREKLKERGNYKLTELLVERQWRREETTQNISGKINKKIKKWSLWEYEGCGYLMDFFFFAI